MKNINVILEKQHPPCLPYSESKHEILFKIIHINTTDILEEVNPGSPCHTAWKDLFSAILCVNCDEPPEIKVSSSTAPENPSFLTLCFSNFQMWDSSRYCIDKNTSKSNKDSKEA